MGNAIKTAPQKSVAPTVRELISGEEFRSAISAALPSHLKPDRFVRIALTALNRTPKLAECDQGSLFACLMNLSQLGLEPDGRRAHLIPFWNSKRNVHECQLIIDYKGLVELALRSGKISFIHADVVCENDAFEYDRGEIKQHKIDLRKQRGDVYAVYAFSRFKDGTEKCEVLSRDDVELVRKRSRAGGSGPWVTDWNEMAKKTAFRRLSKWIELSPEVHDAVDSDDDTFDKLPQASRMVHTTTVEALSVDPGAGEPRDPETSRQEPKPLGQPKTESTSANDHPDKQTARHDELDAISKALDGCETILGLAQVLVDMKPVVAKIPECPERDALLEKAWAFLEKSIDATCKSYGTATSSMGIAELDDMVDKATALLNVSGEKAVLAEHHLTKLQAASKAAGERIAKKPTASTSEPKKDSKPPQTSTPSDARGPDLPEWKSEGIAKFYLDYGGAALEKFAKEKQFVNHPYKMTAEELKTLAGVLRTAEQDGSLKKKTK